LRWSSARYYAAPGEVLLARCIFQRWFAASGEGHTGSARCMRIQHADIALLLEMLLSDSHTYLYFFLTHNSYIVPFINS
jgi:hypothetical protein